MAINELEVCSSGRISSVTKMFASYPYKFLKSSLSDKIFTTVYILGFGGGAVSGDSQEVTIGIQENAILLLRTQGSTKIFKSVDGKYSSQKLTVNLSSRSLLAFLPDPTVCFKGSRYIQQQSYNLAESASLVLVDWYTAGRMSRGESWLLDHLLAKLEISIGGEKVIFEKLDLQDTLGIATAAEKVGHAAVFGSVVLIGTYTLSVREKASAIMQRQTFREIRELDDVARRTESTSTGKRKNLIQPGKPLVSSSDLGNDITILRFAADSTEDGYKFLAEVLGPLCTGDLIGLPIPYADRLHCLPVT